MSEPHWMQPNVRESYVFNKLLEDAISGGEIPSATPALVGLTDVEISNPSDGQLVAWNAAAAKWEAVAPPTASLPAGGLTGQILGKNSNADDDVTWLDRMDFLGAWLPGSSWEALSVVSFAGNVYVCTEAGYSGPTYIGVRSVASTSAAANVAIPSGASGCQAGDLAVVSIHLKVSGTPNLPAGMTSIYAAPTQYALLHAQKVLTSADITAGVLSISAQPSEYVAKVQYVRGVASCDTAKMTANASNQVPAGGAPTAGLSLVMVSAVGASGATVGIPGFSGVDLAMSPSASANAALATGYIIGDAGTPGGTVTGSLVFNSTPSPLAFVMPLTLTTPPNFEAMGTLPPARATASTSTQILSNGQIATSAAMPLSLGYRLYSIQTSQKARVRLYTTSAAQTADQSRAYGTAYAVDAGVVLDFQTADTNVHTLSPNPQGADMSALPTGNIPMSVTNLDTPTASITVTMVYVRTE